MCLAHVDAHVTAMCNNHMPREHVSFGPLYMWSVGPPKGQVYFLSFLLLVYITIHTHTHTHTRKMTKQYITLDCLRHKENNMYEVRFFFWRERETMTRKKNKTLRAYRKLCQAFSLMIKCLGCIMNR